MICYFEDAIACVVISKRNNLKFLSIVSKTKGRLKSLKETIKIGEALLAF